MNQRDQHKNVAKEVKQQLSQLEEKHSQELDSLKEQI